MNNDDNQLQSFEPTSVRDKGYSPSFYFFMAIVFTAGWFANDLYRGNTGAIKTTFTPTPFMHDVPIESPANSVAAKPAVMKSDKPKFQPIKLFQEEEGGQGTRIISGTVVNREPDRLIVDIEYYYDGEYGDGVKVGVYPNMSNWSVSTVKAISGKHRVSINISSRAAVTLTSSSLNFMMEAYKDNKYLGAIARQEAPYNMIWKKENSEEVIKKLAQEIPYSSGYEVKIKNPDHIQYIFDNANETGNRVHSITIKDKTNNRAVVEIDYSYPDVIGEKTRIVAVGIVPGIPNSIGIMSVHHASKGRHKVEIPISIFSMDKPKQFNSAAIRIVFKPIKGNLYAGDIMEKIVPYHREWQGIRAQHN